MRAVSVRVAHGVGGARGARHVLTRGCERRSAGTWGAKWEGMNAHTMQLGRMTVQTMLAGAVLAGLSVNDGGGAVPASEMLRRLDNGELAARVEVQEAVPGRWVAATYERNDAPGYYQPLYRYELTAAA